MGRLGNWYEPVAEVAAVNGCSRIGLVSVTTTPGSTPPDSSVTFPKISPVGDWARAEVAPSSSASAAITAVKRTLIISPPETRAENLFPVSRINATTGGGTSDERREDLCKYWRVFAC